MKKIYLSSLVLASALTLNAQSKLDFSVQAVIDRANNEMLSDDDDMLIAPMSVNEDGVKMARVIVSTNDLNAAQTELEALGAEISNVIGDNIVCSIPLTTIEQAGNLESIKNITAVKKVRLINNKARVSTNVDQVRAGEGLDQSYTGEGTIVGLFDMGLDPNHVNFLKSDLSESRVKRIWKYTYNERTGKTTTTSYTTASAISNFTTDDSDECHGTHVLGIAAGAYNKTANDYSGMAPDAELAIACGDATYDALLDGVENIINYAESENKPCVINLSLGTNVGHHDGTDSFNQSLSALAAKAPICISSGNEADYDIVIKKTMTSSDTKIQTFLVPNTDYLDTGTQAYGNIEIIGPDSSEFDVSLGIYSTSTKSIVYTLAAGTGTYNYVGGSRSGYTTNTYFTSAFSTSSYMGAAKGVCADNNRYYAYIALSLTNKSTYSSSYYPVLIVTGKAGKTYEVYSDGYTMFSSKSVSGYDAATTDGTINEMACGQNVITVGAYTDRAYSSMAAGDIAYFSSWGTLIDGRELPHFCAPGVKIVSSLSTPFLSSSEYSTTYYPTSASVTYNNRKNYWTTMSGTSMSSPVATGTVALWLQADPTLTPLEIRDIAQSTAKKDSYVTGSTTAQSTVQWGAGKLDALAGIKEVLSKSSVGKIFEDNAQSVIVTTDDNRSFDIYAAAETKVSASLVDMSGRTVAATSAAGDHVVLDANSASAGIYVLLVGGDHTSYSRKIVVK
jgi:subtilisin family serine protease